MLDHVAELAAAGPVRRAGQRRAQPFGQAGDQLRQVIRGLGRVLPPQLEHEHVQPAALVGAEVAARHLLRGQPHRQPERGDRRRRLDLVQHDPRRLPGGQLVEQPHRVHDHLHVRVGQVVVDGFHQVVLGARHGGQVHRRGGVLPVGHPDRPREQVHHLVAEVLPGRPAQVHMRHRGQAPAQVLPVGGQRLALLGEVEQVVEPS